jgi:hypothetical protein
MFDHHIAQDGLGAHAESGIAKRLITSDGTRNGIKVAIALNGLDFE